MGRPSVRQLIGLCGRVLAASAMGCGQGVATPGEQATSVETAAITPDTTCSTSTNEALQIATGQFARVAPSTTTAPPDFTLESWVYLSSVPSGVSVFVAKPLGSAYSDSFATYLNGGAFYAVVGTADSAQGQHYVSIPTSSMTPQAGQWYFVALTYDHLQGTMHLHVFDSVGGSARAAAQLGTNSAIAYDDPEAGVVHPLLFGADVEYGKHDNFFDGIIDQVALWDVVRSATQISADRARCQPATTLDLMGYWPLQGTGRDVSGNGNRAMLSQTSAGTPVFVVPSPNVPF